MKKAMRIICLIMLLVMLLSEGVSADRGFSGKKGEESIKKAIGYLHGMQNADGGFCARKGGESSKALTSWVIMALAAAGENISGSEWAPSGKNPLDFLKNSSQPLKETGDYARLLLAYAAAGKGAAPETEELAAKIISFQQEDGQFWQADQGETGMINAHMWSILALAAAGKEIPRQEKAKNWLISQQNDDGGFGWLEGVESDADDTAVAIQALVLLGEKPDSPAIKSALNFLKGYQQDNGGFSAGEWMGKEANACSDAWVVQGILAAGEDPGGEKWTVNHQSPITHLLSLQNQDGSFNWKAGTSSSPVTTTAFVVMALAGKPHPVNILYGFQSSGGGSPGLFFDLAAGHWAYDSIKSLVEAGVLGGYPDGTFRPEKPVTRAEFAKFLVWGLGLQNEKSNSAARFSDIPSRHWAWPFISVAVDREYINGRPDGTFGLNGEITGAELAAMLVRTLPLEKRENIAAGPKWYSGYVKASKEEGLLYPDFEESAGATRAQCAFSISQLLKSLQEK